MDKKEINEHLAKIYLDASSKKKKKGKPYSKLFKNLFFVSIVFILVLSINLFNSAQSKKPLNSEISLVLLTDAAKINFNFDPAKKEIYNLTLNNLKMHRFNTLGFAVKKTNYQDKISLRVEFTNSFNEKSEIYIKDISSKWQDFKIKFSDFKNISDWSQMTNLCFVVEEWNSREKNGVVYIDNVRLLK